MRRTWATARTSWAASTLRAAFFGSGRCHLFSFETSAAVDIQLAETLAGTADFTLGESAIAILIEGGQDRRRWALFLFAPRPAPLFGCTFRLGRANLLLRDAAIAIGIELSKGVPGCGDFLRREDAVLVGIKRLHDRWDRWSWTLGAILPKGSAGSEGDDKDC